MPRLTHCKNTECTKLVADAHNEGRTGFCMRCSKARGLMKGNPGHKLSEEAKNRISAANTGRTRSQEHCAAVSKAHMGNKYNLGRTPWNKGKAHSEETKRKLKEAWETRDPVSQETRNKQQAHQLAHPQRYWLGKKQPIHAIAKRSGKNHPCWKGGITPVNTKIRCLDEYRIWRNSVYQRDNYTCQDCGAKGNLNADHIIPFAIIVRDNNVQSCEDARKCEKLWDTNNGRTLCVDCHKKTPTFGILATKQTLQVNY